MKLLHSYNAMIRLPHSFLQGKNTVNLHSLKSARQTVTHFLTTAQTQCQNATSVDHKFQSYFMSPGLQALCDFPETLVRPLPSSTVCLHGVMKRISVDTETAPRSYIKLRVSPGTVVVNLEAAYEGQRSGGQASAVHQHTCASLHKAAKHLLRLPGNKSQAYQTMKSKGTLNCSNNLSLFTKN